MPDTYLTPPNPEGNPTLKRVMEVNFRVTDRKRIRQEMGAMGQHGDALGPGVPVKQNNMLDTNTEAAYEKDLAVSIMSSKQDMEQGTAMASAVTFIKPPLNEIPDPALSYIYQHLGREHNNNENCLDDLIQQESHIQNRKMFLGSYLTNMKERNALMGLSLHMALVTDDRESTLTAINSIAERYRSVNK